MKYQIGNMVIYHEDLYKFNSMILKHKGKIVGYSTGTDVVFGEYEVSYFHQILNKYQKCVVKESDLSIDIVEERIIKILKIIKNIKNGIKIR